jgi:hypothetical protein
MVMISRISAIVVVFLLIAASVAISAQTAARADRSTISLRTAPATEMPSCADATVPDSVDARWQWRLRAFNHLDCVTALVDRALGSSHAGSPATAALRREDQTVTISRADLERIRMLAWWARDAAARIGQ